MTLKQTLHLRHATHFYNELARLDKQYRQGGQSMLTALAEFDHSRGQILHAQQWLADDQTHDEETIHLRINYCTVAAVILKIRLMPADYLQWLDAALKDVRSLTHAMPAVEANLLHSQGGLYIEIGRYEAARRSLEHSLKMTRRHHLPEIETQVQNDLEHLALLQGRLSSVLKPGFKPPQKASIQDVASLVTQANAFMMTHQYRDAAALLEPAMEVARESDDLITVAAVAHTLGNIYNHLEDFEQAQRCGEEELAIGKSLSHQDMIANGLLVLGTSYDLQDRHDESLACFVEALDIGHSLNNRRTIGSAYAGLGNISMMQKNYPEAIDYFHKARDIFVEIDVEHDIKTIDGLLGQCHTHNTRLFRLLDLNPLNPYVLPLMRPLFRKIRIAWRERREKKNYK